MLRMLPVVACIVLSAASAAAGETTALTEDQAKRFAASLDSVGALADEFKAEGKRDPLSSGASPKMGVEFKPYSSAVAAMKEKYPADHARLAALVKRHGFSTNEWADVGDRVMVAYLAVRMLEEDPRTLAMMEGLDQSMLDMAPPDMRAELEQSFAMMEMARNAPEADKNAIAVIKDDLDAYVGTKIEP